MPRRQQTATRFATQVNATVEPILGFCEVSMGVLAEIEAVMLE
jgi:hypothetical protein